jgi:hypothetical protein
MPEGASAERERERERERREKRREEKRREESDVTCGLSFVFFSVYLVRRICF